MGVTTPMLEVGAPPGVFPIAIARRVKTGTRAVTVEPPCLPEGQDLRRGGQGLFQRDGLGTGCCLVARGICWCAFNFDHPCELEIDQGVDRSPPRPGSPSRP